MVISERNELNEIKTFGILISGHSNIAHLLIEHGANANGVNNDGTPILIMAIDRG